MRDILKILLFCGRKEGSQLGFTLAELMISIAISGIILVGSAAILHQIVVSTQENMHKTQAKLEVQYVSFWIGEDVIQAQEVEIGNATVLGRLLRLNWTDELGNGNTTVTYDVQSMPKPDQDLWTLYRVKTDDKGTGNITVAEYLLPWSDEAGKGTKFERQLDLQTGNRTGVLVVTVAAQVDRYEETDTYETQPRMGNVTWIGNTTWVP